jgi:hypothetical protein
LPRTGLKDHYFWCFSGEHNTLLRATFCPDRPRPTTLLPPRSNGKTEATAVYKLLMMGKRMPETCWAVFERRAINLRYWCIWFVDLFECMMTHGLTNPKFTLRQQY